jgi:uncharacterized protein YcbX
VGSVIELTRLRRYPVKSCRGEDLAVAEVEPCGLVGDRRWMVVDPAGEVVTAREANRLVLVDPEIIDRGLRLSAPGTADLVVERPDSGPEVQVEIFDDRLAARLADRVAGDWFTETIGRPLRLVHLDDPYRRPVDPDYAEPGDVVSLADGFPLLLAAEESLARLNSWIAEGHYAADGPVPMTRFRPNLVVRGDAGFAEDTWRRIRVGEVVFRVAKPCARCVLTTIDPETAIRTKEPLVSLARHRKIGGKTLFAVNLIPEKPYGPVRVGDEVEVLATS